MVTRISAFCILVAVCLFFAIGTGVMPAMADDSAAILAAIKKDNGGQDTSIQKINTAVPWAVAFTATRSSEGQTWQECHLLKKAGAGWKVINTTGAGPTTDFLRMGKVPAVQWTTLLGADAVARQKPIMTFLRQKNASGYYINLRTSGDWALTSWVSGESGGQTLLKKTAAGWKHVKSDGGALDAASLKSAGVPAADIKPLMGIQ